MFCPSQVIVCANLSVELDRLEKLDEAQRQEQRNEEMKARLREENAVLEAKTEKNRRRRNRKKKLNESKELGNDQPEGNVCIEGQAQDECKPVEEL